MDFYERKKRAQNLIKSMIDQNATTKEIIFAVEDTYQFGENWTQRYLEKLGYEV